MVCHRDEETVQNSGVPEAFGLFSGISNGLRFAMPLDKRAPPVVLWPIEKTFQVGEALRDIRRIFRAVVSFPLQSRVLVVFPEKVIRALRAVRIRQVLHFRDHLVESSTPSQI